MHNQISIVIICRNEAHIIGRTLAAALQVSDDVVVVDSGSTDGTQEMVRSSGARLLETGWEGYGPNKNKGVAMAAHDWILSIDADEVLDATLISQLQTLSCTDEHIVYNIRFRVFFGEQMIRFGEWARDAHIRLYNRKQVNWDAAAVHESLQIPPNTRVITLKGHIHHFTSSNLQELATKTLHYAMLNALKYHRRGKKASWLQRRLAGPFSFFNNYLIRLGFLDGEAGYTIAKMNAWYTWMKYAKLRELNLSTKDEVRRTKM
jgi:glycosyltransferase involved in cell wall biosynthesis